MSEYGKRNFALGKEAGKNLTTESDMVIVHDNSGKQIMREKNKELSKMLRDAYGHQTNRAEYAEAKAAALEEAIRHHYDEVKEVFEADFRAVNSASPTDWELWGHIELLKERNYE